MTNREQMTELCRKIHTVARCAGVEPWDAHQFAKAQRGRSTTEKIAASFVLTVWTQEPHGDWSGLPEFSLVEAAARCDESILAVIAEWVRNPFWP